MKVILTTSRVENLIFIKKEFEKANVIILEEPRNDLFHEVVEGKIDVDFYVRKIGTQFPVYTARKIEMLRNMRGKEILQIEPYLEEVEKIRNFSTGDEGVREMERKVNKAHAEYTESFMIDFDEIVEKYLNFARADAERILMRDRMRAEAIKPADDLVVEAGIRHIKLAELLDAEAVFIPGYIAGELGMEYRETPVDALMRALICEEDCDYSLLAARSLIFITLVEKREMVPDFEGDYPHFVHEQKLARFVSKLDYERCKKFFKRFWSHK
ncbi:hypothetical protein [Archaeoglobus neptunius]|uniref:hypothetical protein n=1 Tax=Archaeoglobus neptunius TaxID=2798580 RepID=UPI00192774F6|nr:hypothetical protein [Archaeoglobus neptunius]